ncbi:MAG: DUF4215 domain-containing protein [bacterium]
MTSNGLANAWRLFLLGSIAAALGCGARTPYYDPLEGVVCGNDLLESGEDCDGQQLQGVSCGSLGYAGGVLRCSAECRLDPSACVAPTGCGDGAIDGSEQCDGPNLGGESCDSLGYVSGELRCAPTCRFDTDACRRREGCGDGVVEPGEECDDGNLVPCDGCDAGCRVERCGNSYLDCAELCDDGNTVDGDGCTSTCVIEDVCGNAIAEPEVGEECDGADLAGASCADHCFTGGTVSCTAGCALDTSQCTGGPVCGDGVAECDEACDGADLSGDTCSSLGFTGGGVLACDSSCERDVSGCTGPVHYFYEDFEDPAAASAAWSLTGDWEVGAPGSHWAEPAQAYLSLNCLATRLGDAYSNNQAYLTSMAVTPVINLTLATAPVLTLQGWLSTVRGEDGVNLWVRREGSSVWELLASPQPAYNDVIQGEPAFSASWASWTLVTVDLSAFAGDRIQLGAGFASDGSTAKYGAYLDDFLVAEP